MSFFHGPEPATSLLLTLCVCGAFLQPAEQVPVGEGFNRLYPVSVMGPYGSQTLLIALTGTEQNTQRSRTPADSSKISAPGVSKSLPANSGFLQPDPAPGPAPGPAPSPAPSPSESWPLQGQVSNYVPSNLPLQVYSFLQQAVISDSGSSEEGAAAQVIYMVPISVGVMEGPGPLQVPASTTPAAAGPEARGQRGNTAGTQTPAPGQNGL